MSFSNMYKNFILYLENELRFIIIETSKLIKISIDVNFCAIYKYIQKSIRRGNDEKES